VAYDAASFGNNQSLDNHQPDISNINCRARSFWSSHQPYFPRGRCIGVDEDSPRLPAISRPSLTRVSATSSTFMMVRVYLWGLLARRE